MESRGIFRGFAAIAHDTAIALELDESHGGEQGRLRLIPSQMIIAIDILKAEKQKEEKEPEGAPVYFG